MQPQPSPLAKAYPPPAMIGDAAETARLSQLLGVGGTLADLNRLLADRIANGETDLETPGLADHLWQTTMEKLAVERGTVIYDVTVRDLIGVERDRIYAEQARRYPGFAEYAHQTEGVRTIPVVELTRA